MSDPDGAPERGKKAGRGAPAASRRKTSGAPDVSQADEPSQRVERATDREPRPNERFPSTVRLRKRSEFLEVQSRGARLHTPHFVLLVLRTEPQTGQLFGVTATRKLGGAVMRNRVKRVLREVFRRNRELFPPDCRLVAVARAGAAGLDYAAARAEIAEARGALERAARLAAPAQASRSSRRSAPPRKPPSSRSSR
jgi:ribonuclease P protein component